MNMGRKAVKQFFVWLLLGAAAGVFLAAVLSYHEYQTMADLAEAVMRWGSLPKGLKEGYGVELETEERAEDSMDSRTGGGTKDSADSRTDSFQDGEELLEDYGYHSMRNWGAYLPFTEGISIFLFETAGFLTFLGRYREDMRTKRRIRELTEYLRAVNSGEGAVLSRNEDDFSRLEDEMYKTVMELQSTKEAAVKNHEVLAERIADIAHQLKTPLTSMSLMTELLEEYQTVETREYYSRLSHQIERLKNLVAGLLSLAKLDSHGIVFRRERIELPELMDSAAEALGGMMEDRGISFVTAKCASGGMPADCFIYADRQWTEEALLNILKNCVEHTPDGGRIKAVYEQNPLYVELRIEDGGSGFAKKDLPHVFERFYRGEGAKKDNAGIGLALAKAVLERQNGYLYAENTEDGHAGFRVKWYQVC